MESQDQRAAVVSKVLWKYRKVVRILRVLPFAYLAVFAVISIGSGLMSERFASIVDCILFISPLASAVLLLLSGALGMCNWHRAACLLPYSSRVVTFIDTNLVTLTQNELTVINIAIGLLTAFFIFLAFRHFLCRTTSSKT